VVHDANADLALFHVRVLHEGHDRARRGVVVAEIEVPRARVILVDGLLEQPQAQQVAVEAHSALEVATDRRDVVQTLQRKAWRL
jgi:hypothetical protein